MPTTSFHAANNIANNRRFDHRSSRFCCPGDDETRSFSAFPVSTSMCFMFQALTLAGLIAGTVTEHWRVYQWSVGDTTRRRFWGLWQTCTRMYGEHGLRMTDQKCYSRFDKNVDGSTVVEDYLDEWEMTCLALMVFACVQALIGTMLHLVCCLRSPICLIIWAIMSLVICGSTCIIYSTHFMDIRDDFLRSQSKTVNLLQSIARSRLTPEDTYELGWSFYLAVASTVCQLLLIGSMIMFCIYATRRSRNRMNMAQQQPLYRSRESVV